MLPFSTCPLLPEHTPASANSQIKTSGKCYTGLTKEPRRMAVYLNLPEGKTMTDEEIRVKALDFALRCVESKLLNISPNTSINQMVNDVIASAKKIEKYIKP